VDLKAHLNSQIFGVKTAKNQWEILEYSNEILQRWKFTDPIKAKPLFIEHEHDFMLFYESSEKRLILMSLSDRT
jgi:hypothetical protein